MKYFQLWLLIIFISACANKKEPAKLDANFGAKLNQSIPINPEYEILIFNYNSDSIRKIEEPIFKLIEPGDKVIRYICYKDNNFNYNENSKINSSEAIDFSKNSRSTHYGFDRTLPSYVKWIILKSNNRAIHCEYSFEGKFRGVEINTFEMESKTLQSCLDYDYKFYYDLDPVARYDFIGVVSIFNGKRFKSFWASGLESYALFYVAVDASDSSKGFVQTPFREVYIECTAKSGAYPYDKNIAKLSFLFKLFDFENAIPEGLSQIKRAF